VIATGVGTAQVGGSIAAAGAATVHESATVPVKPHICKCQRYTWIIRDRLGALLYSIFTIYI
jgi:hypothetical protein